MPQKRNEPRVCIECGGDFFTYPAEVKRGCGLYCNRSCANAARAVYRYSAEEKRLRDVWRLMMRRCYDPNNRSYKDYGGRGIEVCEEWRADFLAFSRYVGSRPSPEHSLDRRNNNGNYEPGNVRWATRTEQARNARSNVLLTYKGRTQCVAAWAQEIGLRPVTVMNRYRRGNSIEDILSPNLRPSRWHSTRLPLFK